MPSSLRRRHLLPLLAIVLAATPLAAEEIWPPADGVPLTTWGKEVDPDRGVWGEYPRPHLVRAAWLNLNGWWDLAIVPAAEAAPQAFPERIVVPYPIEALLSRIGRRLDPGQRAWYHRSTQVPAAWSGQRILLHLDAANWETQVLVNGKAIGTHRGGYDRFSFDITEALRPGADAVQDLTIAVGNPVDTGQPCGKQSLHPSGIFYTPCSGIWQTVWLEPVPATHVEEIRIATDIDQATATIDVQVAQPGQAQVEAVVRDGERVVARAQGPAGKALSLPIPTPRLWSPATPFLYDVQVTLRSDGAVSDSATSYFGMRKISLGRDADGKARILLNNVFVMQCGLLDQGYWPDGIYTAPSDLASRSDIEATKLLGANMLRKHAKVEPERWYAWADRLGMLVWQDMPSSTPLGHGPSPRNLPDLEGIFAEELRRLVSARACHPSIVVWVPFNEGWGLTEAAKTRPGEPDRMDPVSVARQERMLAVIRSADPSRLVDLESGAGGGANQGANFWDTGRGDLVDFHCYGGKGPPGAEAQRAAVIGETGWGLDFAGSLRHQFAQPRGLGLSAIVITQLTDVENERNGALRYDRTAKAPLAAMGAQVAALLRSLHLEPPP